MITNDKLQYSAPIADKALRDPVPDPWRIEPSPLELIDDPLDFFFAEHHRQRCAAHMIFMVTGGDFDEEGVRGLIRFLEEDFAWHVADEELVFFPMLRACCLPEDNIDKLIAKLAEEHEQDELLVEGALRLLRDRLVSGVLHDWDRPRLRQFAEHVHQHIALENAVLLPIARARMDREALRSLAKALAERRAGLCARRES